MLLHIPLTISDGLRVGSSTTSTISAPLGSFKCGSTKSALLGWFGGGGGGGGGRTSTEAVVTWN